MTVLTRWLEMMLEMILNGNWIKLSNGFISNIEICCLTSTLTHLLHLYHIIVFIFASLIFNIWSHISSVNISTIILMLRCSLWSHATLLPLVSCYASHFCFLFRGVFVIFIGPELRWLEDICRHVLRHELRCVSATEYESIASNTIKPPVRTNQKHPLNLFIHSWSHLLPWLLCWPWR